MLNTNFDPNIEKYLKILREDFDFMLIGKTMDEVVLSNDFVLLSIQLETGDSPTVIVTSKENNLHVFSVLQIVDFLFPHQNVYDRFFAINDRDTKQYQIESLEFKLKEAVSHLSSVFFGNFTWAESLKNKNNDDNILFEFASSKLEYDHPVRIKMENGDESWREDVLKLMSHHVSQPKDKHD